MCYGESADNFLLSLVYSASIGENKKDFDNIKMRGTTTKKKGVFKHLCGGS
jgi:hypothetical protein